MEASVLERPRRNRLWRLGALVLVIVSIAIIAYATGLRQAFSLQKIRALVVGAGALGVLIYVGGFIVGELIHVPGLMFVAIGVATWGAAWGSLLGWGTSLVSVAISFFLVRAVGGEPPGDSRFRVVRYALRQLAIHPVRTTAALRAVVMATPTVTCLLALTPVRFSRMMIGTAIGLIVPVGLVTLFVHRALSWFAT